MAAAEQLITANLDIWSSAVKTKSAAGRGKSNKLELYGIKKLRELILELAVRGLLVPQDPNDEPASELLRKIAAAKAKMVKAGKIKKQKALPPIEEDEKSFELSEGWEWSRFSVLAMEYSVGLDRGKSQQGAAKKYRYFKMNNIENSGGFDLSDIVTVDADTSEVEKYSLRSDDLLFNTRNSRELVGKTCVFIEDDHGPMLYNNNILRARFSPNDLSYMLDLWMRSPAGKGELEKRKSGTTNVWAIYQGKLETLACPIAPEAEQHRIVAKVDELMALCDQLEQQQETSITAHQTLVKTLLDALTTASERDGFIAAWARIADHFDTLFTTEWSIDQLKQTILQLAVMGKLVPQDPNDEPASKLLQNPEIEGRGIIRLGKGKVVDLDREIIETDISFELPSGWEFVRLGKILEVIGGSQPPKSVFKDKPQKGYTRLIQIRDFKNDNFPTYVPDEFANRPFDEEDIMIGRYGPPVFQILRGRSGTYNVALMKANPLGEALTGDFMFHLLEEPRIQNLVISESERTAGQSGVRKEVIYEFVVGLPPKDEQNRIVSKVSELMALCDTLKTRFSTAQTTRLQLADAMAAQAVA